MVGDKEATNSIGVEHWLPPEECSRKRTPKQLGGVLITTAGMILMAMTALGMKIMSPRDARIGATQRMLDMEPPVKRAATVMVAWKSDWLLL